MDRIDGRKYRSIMRRWWVLDVDISLKIIEYGLLPFNLCLRGGLGWWFGSLGIDGFVNLEKKYQTLQTMKSLKIKKTHLKQQWLLPD